MEPTHGLLPSLRNLRHLAQLVRSADRKVEEAQLLKVLCFLICNLHDTMVTLGKTSFTETTPRFGSIKLAGSFNGDV